MAEIFLSYSQRDKSLVKPIAEALEAEGFDVFWDPEIPPGETWDNVIARELKAARCVIVAWSEHSTESDWVKEEADFGKRKKALVPVQIDSAGPPLGFSRLQTADLSAWNGDKTHPEWRKVLERVRHHGVEVSPDAQAAEPDTARAGDLRKALYDDPAAEPVRRPEPAAAQPHSQPAAAFAPGAAAAPAAAPAATGKKTGFDFPFVFFNANGRLGKKDFWIGFAIMFGLSMVGALVPVLGPLLQLALIYPGICLYGKRLHDFNMTAWIYGGYLVATFAFGMLIGFMATSGGYMDEELLLGGLAVGFLIQIGFTLWVGLMNGTPGENRYGPPPDHDATADVFS